VVLPPFSELVDAYARDVARLCAALAGPSDAEDAAQRAWLRALVAYKNLRHTGNLRGWLLKIAANAAMDGHRQRARQPVPVAEIAEAAAGSMTNPEPADEDLWRQVRSLPERQRVAVTLRYGLDFAHEQIAEVLGTTQTASRRLVSDGLADLRARLEEVTT
jgi:RNA polymerase sigma factor (sigma-70 family)